MSTTTILLILFASIVVVVAEVPAYRRVMADLCEARDGQCPSCDGKGGNITAYTIFWISNHPKLMQKTKQVQDVIKQHSDSPSSILSMNSLLKLHITSSYLCCHSKDEQEKFKNMLYEMEWDSMEIDVSGFWCNYEMHNKNSSDHTPIYLHGITSSESEAQLANFTSTVERQAQNLGIPIYNPRAKAGPVFHMTIATVNARYPLLPLENDLRGVSFGRVRLCFIVNSNPLWFSWARDCRLEMSEAERKEVEEEFIQAMKTDGEGGIEV